MILANNKKIMIVGMNKSTNDKKKLTANENNLTAKMKIEATTEKIATDSGKIVVTNAA